jgi:hypothetical protein
MRQPADEIRKTVKLATRNSILLIVTKSVKPNMRNSDEAAYLLAVNQPYVRDRATLGCPI